MRPTVAVDALGEVMDWYAGHGLPARFSLPSPVADPLGLDLRGRGFVETVHVHVMVADVASLPRTTGPPRRRGGWLGVTAVQVAPSHRRRGLAGRLLAGLVDWGRAHGARAVYLQVSADNAPALGMYRRAGLVVHHDYRYVEAPTTGAA